MDSTSIGLSGAKNLPGGIVRPALIIVPPTSDQVRKSLFGGQCPPRRPQFRCGAKNVRTASPNGRPAENETRPAGTTIQAVRPFFATESGCPGGSRP